MAEKPTEIVPEVTKHVPVTRVEDVQPIWCAFGCGAQMSKRAKRESLWDGCKRCENERLGTAFT